MIRVVGIKFKRAGKVYYFDPVGLELRIETPVIVETARGLEFGTVATLPKSVPEEEVIQPLKPIVRLATEEDKRVNANNLKKKKDALKICKEKVRQHQLEMKLIDVEYTFDNNKIIFYFTADGRIDFRALVKDLATIFRMRIELRQVGVRDEAKMKGGVGNCGRELCCHKFLTDFHPVSIKMAKVQNLSLNPTKISGICGRLMCCLEYENDVYGELRKGLPEVGERVKIPEGLAVVWGNSILEGTVKCRFITQENEESGEGEKYSTEVYTYPKEEVERTDRKRKKRKRNKGKE